MSSPLSALGRFVPMYDRFAVDFVRACFEAGRYEMIAERFAACDSPAPSEALWSIRALVELENYKQATEAAVHWALRAPRQLAGEFHGIEALARLYAGEEIDAVDRAIDAALACGSHVGHVVRASVHVAYGQLAEAREEVQNVRSTLDPYDTQVLLIVKITIAACLQDEDALCQARDELGEFLEAHAGLHYVGWSSFALSRVFFIRGAFDTVKAALQDVDHVVNQSCSRRFKRQVETIRDLATQETLPWQFARPGTDQRDYVPRSMADKASRVRAVDSVLKSRPILNQLYVALMQAGDAGLSKDEIMRELWGVDFDPVRHEARLYKALGRLRGILEDCYAGTLAAVGPKYLLQTTATHKVAH